MLLRLSVLCRNTHMTAHLPLSHNIQFSIFPHNKTDPRIKSGCNYFPTLHHNSSLSLLLCLSTSSHCTLHSHGSSCFPSHSSSQAKPCQRVNWRTSTCSKPKSTAPCLFAIPASDCIAGLYNRHVNTNRGCAYASDFKLRLRALTDHAKD